MRVMLLLSSLAMGGAEKNVVAVLPYLQKYGIHAVLGSLNTRRDSPLAGEFAKTGIERFDMGAKRMLDPTAFRRFLATLREQKIDIVHAQDQDVVNYSALAHVGFGINTIMSRHVMFEPEDTFKEKVRAQMTIVAGRYGFDRVITVSEATRKRFAEQSGLSLDKIETVYNGIPLEQFNTRHLREKKRAEMGWKPDEKIILMVAVLRRGKGHEVLFDAIPYLLKDIPNAKIKLIGEGELSDQLREQAKPYGDVVEFLGQRMDVAELLGGADTLVLPSWSEALPTVLIEAGAASLACVATDVGGTAEIVKDGETGYVVPAGNAERLAFALMTILSSPETAEEMGKRAYERVKNTFSFDKQAKHFIDIYESVLKGKNS
jgi:glycosyltransferase involved in cell wall biosynthesis